MKHYKVNNEIRAIGQGQEFLVQADWIELSDEELHTLLNPPKTEEQILAEKIAEAKAYLAETDYKDLPRYKPKEGEDIEAIYAKRDELREFIRANDVPNP